MEAQLELSQATAIKIAGSHGYRIEGDVAFLNAEIAVLGERAHLAQWALQLWACHEAHAGGTLAGFKIAEAPVELPREEGAPLRVQAEAFARFPAERRAYSMVLVLASASREGAFEQVHDFANYPERQPFATPHLDGAVGYAILDGEVSLRADRVCNPRHQDNRSGTLSLDLCALAEPHHGGELRGEVVASATLGQIAGQTLLENVDRAVPFAAPPAGRWHMVLALREWTAAAGFVTRDFCSFAVPYETPAGAAEPTVAAVETAVAAPEEHAVVAPEEEEHVVVAPAPPVAAPRARRLSLQTATVEELAKVNGLNKKLASEIVKLRPFASVDELVRVRGIGEKTARKLRELLTV
jgi:hypothetical protein